MATPDIRILVGVQGGAGFSAGSSGALIKSTLKQIAENISASNAVKVKIGIDDAGAAKDLKAALDSLSAVANSFKFSPTVDGSDKLIKSYDSLIKKTQELQELRNKFDSAKSALDATDIKADNYKTIVAEYKAAANALHSAVADASAKEAEAADNIKTLISVIPKLGSAIINNEKGIETSRVEQIKETYGEDFAKNINEVIHLNTALDANNNAWIAIKASLDEAGVSSDKVRDLFDALTKANNNFRESVSKKTVKDETDALPDNLLTRVRKSIDLIKKETVSVLKGTDFGGLDRAIQVVNQQINDLNVSGLKNIGDTLNKAIGGATESDRAKAWADLKANLEAAKVPAKDIEAIFKSIETAQQGVVAQSQAIRDSLIGRYQSEVDKLSIGGETYNSLVKAGIDPATIKGYSDGLTDVVDRLKNVNNALDDPRKAGESILKTIDDMVNYKDRLDTLKNTLSSVSAEFGAFKSNTYLRQGYNDLQKTISSASNANDVERAVKKYNEWISSVNELGFAHESLRDKVTSVLGEFGVTLSVASLLRKATSELREMVVAVQEVDSAMVELKKVTSESSSTYRQFLDNAKETSLEIGSSVSDLVNASSIFAKMGYDLNDSFDLGTTASILANVGDEIGTVEDAAATLISVVKAFGYAASQAEDIADKFNEVSNSFPITAGGISEALQRSSAALSAAGNTLDESISLIAVANQVVNNPESVGTGWRNIALRIRGAKAELETAGEETDGMITSTSKLQEQVQALTKTASNRSGVNILTDAGAFKSTYQIIKEIGAVWNEISDVNQAALLETIGGKRGAQILTSVFANIGDLDSVTSTSLTSANSAMREHANWLDSIEAKQARFSSAYQSFADSILGSDLVKFTYDSGTGILGFFTDITNKVGSFPALVTAATAALGVLGKQNGLLTYGINKNGEAGFTTIFNKMFGAGDTKANIQSLIDVYNKLDDAQRNSLSTNKEYQTALGKLSGGMQNYISTAGLAGKSAQQVANGYREISLKATAAQISVSLLNTAISFGVSLAISALVGWITEMANATKEAIETTSAVAESIKEETSDIDEYKSKAIELTEALQSQNLTSEEVYKKRRELIDLQTQMIGLYGDEASQIDILCGSVDELSDSFDRLSESRAKGKLVEGYAGFLNAYSGIKSSKNWISFNSGVNPQDEVYTLIKDWMAQNGGTLSAYLDRDGGGQWGSTIKFDGLTSAETAKKIEELDDFIVQLSQRLNVDLSEFRRGLSNGINGLLTDDYNAMQEAVDAYLPLLVKYDERFSDAYEKAQDAIEAYKNGIAEGLDQEQITTLYNNVRDALAPTFDGMTGTEVEAVKEYYENLLDEFKKQNLTHEVSVDLNQIVTLGYSKNGTPKAVAEYLQYLGTLAVSDVKNIGTWLGADGVATQEEIAISPYTSYQVRAYELVSEAAAAAGVSTDEYIDSLAELGYIEQDAIVSTEQYNRGIEDTSSAYLDRIRILNEAIAEQERMGYISNATYQALIDANEEWSGAVDVSTGKVVASADTLKGYISEQAKAGYQALITAGATQNETDEFLRLSTVMSSMTFDDVAVSRYGEAVEFLSAALRTMRSDAALSASEIALLSSAFPELSAQIQDGELSISDMSGLLVSSVNQIIDVVYKAINGYVFNEQEIAKLISLYPELANAITATSNGYQVDASAALNAANSKVQAANNAIQAQIEETNAVIQNVQARINAYQLELAALGRLMDSLSAYSSGMLNGTIDYNNMTEEQKAQWRSYMEAQSRASAVSQKIAESEAEMANAKAQLASLTTSLSQLNTGYNNASNAVQNFTSAQNGSSNATNNATKALQDQKEALEEQRDLLNDQIDAVNDLIDLVVEMIKKEKELEKEGLQEQLDTYKKLIDSQKELLSLKEDEYNYEKSLNEATGNVDRIQAKIDALRYDDSAEANAKRLKLYEELSDAQAELDELNHEREISLQEKALDDEYKRYEEQLNKQIKAIDDYLSKEGQIRQDAMALIDNKSQELYNRLLQYNRQYGDGVDQTITDAWNKAYAALGQYGGGVINFLSQVNSILASLDTQIDSLADAISNASASTGGLSSNLGTAAGNAAGLTYALAAANQQLANQNYLTAEQIALIKAKSQAERAEQNTTTSIHTGKVLVDRNIEMKYHTGGVVGEAGYGQRYTGRSLKPDELLAVLQKGEVVMTQEHQANLTNFIKGAFETPVPETAGVSRYKAANTGSLGTVGQIVMGDVIVNGNADNNTVDEIRKVQEKLVNKVFEKIQGLNRQVGYSRNMKTVSV